MLARAFRRTVTRARQTPVAIEPTANPIITIEKPPAPACIDRWISVGTPAIQQPVVIVIAAPNVMTAVESAIRGRNASIPSRSRGVVAVRRSPSAGGDAQDEGSGHEERRRVDREERPERQEREQAGRDGPAADRQRLRGRLDERVRALDVLAVDDGRDRRPVRGGEVARRRLEDERGQNEPPEGERAVDRRDSHRHEHGAAHEIGPDHELSAAPTVRRDPAVQAEHDPRDAVGEPHRDHPERAAGLQREPHQRDVVQRIAELADRDRREQRREVAPPEQG